MSRFQLIIGNYGLSLDQARVQMAVWSVLAAPLLMSVDLATIRPEFKEILLNKEIIAVDQDPLGKQGLRIWNSSNCEVIINITILITLMWNIVVINKTSLKKRC